MTSFNAFFTLFSGIIPSAHMATVVREGKFAFHKINNATQLVFMDEWTADSLSGEDAKRVLQGNTRFIQRFINNESQI